MLRGGEFSKTAEVFNPDLGEWTFTGELNDSRLSPAIFELPDGKVILTGGFHRKNGPLNSTEIWDPITGIWISGPEMIKARHEMSYIKLNDGRFMVFGGGTYDVDGLVVSGSKETEIFDPEIGKWTAAAPMSEKRSNHVAIKLDDGKVFVIGGGKLDGPYSKSSEIYNPDTDSWTIAAPMLKGRVAHTATLLSDGKVLVVGGRGKITKAEIYDPNSDTWSYAGETTKPRAGHVSVRLSNGSVLVTGGLGFIGSKVVLQLLKRNIDVIVADVNINKNKNRLEENIRKIGANANLVQYEKLDITDHKQIDTIFHNNNLKKTNF